MGVKRPLEDENLLELALEQSKQFPDNKKPAFGSDDFPFWAVVLGVDSLAKSDCKLDSHGVLENGGESAAFVAGDKEVEASEEDVGAKSSPFCLPGYINFDMPWRPPQQVDDPYVYLLNVPPRKEIPVGPDYQAEVPKWDPSASRKDFRGSNRVVDNDWEKKWLATCITPMPGLNDLSNDRFTVGHGKATDCSCHDMGSMRCVQQHVREAREKLGDTLGDEMFTKLGFYEMGEEIAHRWSSKEQQLFHQIIFSNPGRDFWCYLSAILPTRRKKELISYYFNVFVLRRRGAQNRSRLLQIDSDHEDEQNIASVDYQRNHPSVDDDVMQGDAIQLINGNFLLVRGEEEDTDVESFYDDQELDVGWVDDCVSEPENACGNEDINISNGACEGKFVEKDGVGECGHVTSNCNGHKQDDFEVVGGAGQMPGSEIN